MQTSLCAADRRRSTRTHGDRERQQVPQSEASSLNYRRNTLEPHTHLTVSGVPEVRSYSQLVSEARQGWEVGGT